MRNLYIVTAAALSLAACGTIDGQQITRAANPICSMFGGARDMPYPRSDCVAQPGEKKVGAAFVKSDNPEDWSEYTKRVAAGNLSMF